MADIYSSRTTTQRGEGHRSLMKSTSVDNSTSTVEEAAVTTAETTSPQESVTQEQPGKVTSETSETTPAFTRREFRPAVTSTQTEAASTIARKQLPSRNAKVVTDDYGIKVTFRINIRDLIS